MRNGRGLFQNNNGFHLGREDVVRLHVPSARLSVASNCIVFEHEGYFTHCINKLLRKTIATDKCIVCVEDRHYTAVVFGLRGSPVTFVLIIDTVLLGLFQSFFI